MNFSIALIFTLIYYAMAAPLVDEAGLTSRIQHTDTLGTCIDMCLDSNWNKCKTICIDAYTCTNLNPDWIGENGISSINFAGSTQCWLYDQIDCQGNNINMPQAQPDLRNSVWNDNTLLVDAADGINLHEHD
jgi:hypothetical protein